MILTDLTMLAFSLNMALDLGRHERITIEEARHHIEKGDLFDWLPAAADAHFDFSLQRANGSDKEIIEKFRSLSNAVDAERKFGVQKSGLCLLLAYTIELIQQTRHS